MTIFDGPAASPGYFSAEEGKRLLVHTGEPLSRAVGEHLARRLKDVEAWQRVPVVARLRLSTAQANAKGFAKLGPVLVGAAGKASGSSSFLFADASGIRRTLTIVLYDWSTLNLDLEALSELGCPVAQLRSLLVQGANPVRQAAPRWSVRDDGKILALSSGDRQGDDKVEPRVGRFGLGALAWSCDSGGPASVELELLALPRLHRPRVLRSPDRAVALNGDVTGWTARLDETIWRVGATDSLVAWLNLSQGDHLQTIDEVIHVTATENASPLAWLPLAKALENAAEWQRRQYLRMPRVVRAPTGTLRVGAYLSYLARQRADLVPVDRFELTHDTPENQLFKAAACRVRRVLASDSGALAVGLRRRFERVEAQFTHAADVEASLSLLARVDARPLPPEQARAAELCGAMLRGRYPGLEVQGRSFAEMEGFELNIAQLFEAAAREVLRRCSIGIGASVQDGNESAKGMGTAKQVQLYWKDAGVVGGLQASSLVHVSLRPDFVVRRGKEVLAVGDAKYKRLQRRDTDSNSSHAPLRREDLHQLVSYLAAWPTTGWAVVIFPNADPVASSTTSDPRPATRLVSELTIGGDRRLGVFDLAAERWSDRRVDVEPLATWIAAQARAG